MASTSLFAPLVPAVQPAFIYDIDIEKPKGEVEIRFSLSPYNENEDFTHVGFSIIDPNRASAWGANSMIKNGGVLAVAKNGNSIKINLTDKDVFKEFDRNQYYQVQLYLIKDNTLKEEMVSVNINSDNVSLPSQVTLIRPIAEPTAIIENSGGQINSYDEEIKGAISYTDDTVIEQIKEVWYEILDGVNVIYTSPIEKNFLGLSFSVPVKEPLYNYVDKSIKVFYKTINDYKGESGKVTISQHEQDSYAEGMLFDKIETCINHSNGTVAFNLIATTQKNIIKIQRSDSANGFLNWKTQSGELELKFIEEKENKEYYHYYWADSSSLLDGGEVYNYCFIENSAEQANLVKQSVLVTPNFESVYLSNKNYLLGIHYNPNISNLKWVTQESVTNTLGGKFPVIRINGDTYYRQFSISGTLCFCAEGAAADKKDNLDSAQKNMNDWINNQDQSLFFNKDTKPQLPFVNGNEDAIERGFRDITLAFLTDRKPKLFRSTTEGSMIVYLSNVSFTPNRQLGRAVYDFSATATEICELNTKNLEKYGLGPQILFTSYFEQEG